MSDNEIVVKAKAERIEAKLELLGHSFTTAYDAEVACAEEVFAAQANLRQAEELLTSNKAAATAAKEIYQTTHGSNAALREDHARDYLKHEYQAVALAESELALAKHKLEQAQRAKSYNTQLIRLTQTRAGILRDLLALEEARSPEQPEGE